MLSAELKEKTKVEHQALEGVVIRQIKSIRNKEQYVALLHKFYGFHKPMELLFDKYLDDSKVPEYSSRRKADLIFKDLQNMGDGNTSISSASKIPVIDSSARAIGAFYVLEGSTQGGAIVADMLIKYAGMTPETTQFFNVYGNNKKQMWDAFKIKMDEHSDPGFIKDAVAAANDTFTAFRQWMEV
jgi:heme oxygenase (biliverdin-IX-beta and delta-forming)